MPIVFYSELSAVVVGVVVVVAAVAIAFGVVVVVAAVAGEAVPAVAVDLLQTTVDEYLYPEHGQLFV